MIYIFLLGTSAQADADYEFFSPSCPVKDSIPGFKFQTISALGIAALANASEDIGKFIEIGCDPNLNQTIKTKCENPPLILAVLYGTAATV